MIRAPTTPPWNNWRRTTMAVHADEKFIARVLELWDKGFDTKDMSRILMETEAVCEVALHIGRNRRVRENVSHSPQV